MSYHKNHKKNGNGKGLKIDAERGKVGGKRRDLRSARKAAVKEVLR